MAEKTLRELAKDYANGVLDKDTYRSERDHLLIGIIANEISVKANEYRPLSKSQDLDRTMEKTEIRPFKNPPAQEPVTAVVTPEIIPDSATSDWKESDSENFFTSKLFFAIAIIVIIFLGYLIFKPEKETQSTETPVSTAEVPSETISEEMSEPAVSIPAATETSGHQSVAASLIESFLNENSWTDESLQTFKNQWTSLSYEEQADELVSPMKSRLANAINQKLVEEKALLALGEDSELVQERQQRLVDFAAEIGINDPRLKVSTE